MSNFTLSSIIFILTLSGIWLGSLLDRRALSRDPIAIKSAASRRRIRKHESQSQPAPEALER